MKQNLLTQIVIDFVKYIFKNKNVLIEESIYVDRISIRKKNKSHAENKWKFKCRDWLSVHQSDGAMKRKLYPTNSGHLFTGRLSSKIQICLKYLIC